MSNASKGVRWWNLIIAKQMAKDRENGMTWGKIATKYRRDKNNARRMVIKINLAAAELCLPEG